MRRQLKDPNQEESFFDKLNKLRMDGVPVSYSHLITEMRELLVSETIKASYGRIRVFKKRYNLTVRTPTEKKQYGNVIDMVMVRNYLRYLKVTESVNQYNTIVNMDETPTLNPCVIYKSQSKQATIKLKDPIARKAYRILLKELRALHCR